MLLTSEAEKLHSMNLLLYMAASSGCYNLLPISLCIEGNVGWRNSFFVFLLLGNGTVAYLVNLTIFLYIKHTSTLTLQVVGNAKAAVAAVVSVMMFGSLGISNIF